MSDYDGFDDNFGQANDVTDEDPAAEFLAREQNELAGLEDDDEGYVVNGVPNGQASYDGFTVIPDQLNGPMSSDERRSSSPQLPPYQLPARPKEVPEKIRKWKEEQETMLTDKDTHEEKKKEELRLSAKRELEEWYRHQTEQIEKTKSQNRNAEKEYVMDRETDVEGASGQQDWERIAKLCDFNPKSCKNTKDVSRMRSIILQLKQTPLARPEK